jgi:hypothetical protein
MQILKYIRIKTPTVATGKELQVPDMASYGEVRITIKHPNPPYDSQDCSRDN